MPNPIKIISDDIDCEIMKRQMQLHKGFGPIVFCDLCPLCLVATGQPDSKIRPSTVLGPLAFRPFLLH